MQGNSRGLETHSSQEIRGGGAGGGETPNKTALGAFQLEGDSGRWGA